MSNKSVHLDDGARQDYIDAFDVQGVLHAGAKSAMHQCLVCMKWGVWPKNEK